MAVAEELQLEPLNQNPKAVQRGLKRGGLTQALRVKNPGLIILKIGPTKRLTPLPLQTTQPLAKPVMVTTITN